MTKDKPLFIELDTAKGLEQTSLQELDDLIGDRYLKNIQVEDSQIRFQYFGSVGKLLQLRTVEAVYLLQQYDIPRPKALLGDQNFRQIIADIETVFSISNRENYSDMYLNAAGSDSSVMQRIKSEIADAVSLSVAEEAGDLLIRIRKRKNRWEVLTRLTPRPLATRPWRVCDYEGALNAPLAANMIRMAKLTAEDRIVNLMCGSGTLMIETLLAYKAIPSVYGVDYNVDALQCASHNLQAAGCLGQATLIQANVESYIPMSSGFATVLFADFPFGNLVGSHAENVAAYPKILNEAARIAKLGARFILITHEVNLILSVLESQEQWELTKHIRVSQRGLTPILCMLTRSPVK